MVVPLRVTRLGTVRIVRRRMLARRMRVVRALLSGARRIAPIRTDRVPTDQPHRELPLKHSSADVGLHRVQHSTNGQRAAIPVSDRQRVTLLRVKSRLRIFGHCVVLRAKLWIPE